jgi:hypothetical protein
MCRDHLVASESSVEKNRKAIADIEAQIAEHERALKLMDTTVVTIAAAPAPTGLDIGALQEQAYAWEAVSKTLNEVCPGWQQVGMTGLGNAVAAIRRLGKDAAMLDWIEAEARKGGLNGIAFDYCRHVEGGQVVQQGVRFIRRLYLGARRMTLRSVIEHEMGRFHN